MTASLTNIAQTQQNMLVLLKYEDDHCISCTFNVVGFVLLKHLRLHKFMDGMAQTV